MSEPKLRTNIRLGEPYTGKVRRIAQQHGIAINDVIRRAIDGLADVDLGPPKSAGQVNLDTGLVGLQGGNQNV